MPARLLRESILDSDSVNGLSPRAEVFYRRLMSVVDDFGRFDGRLSVLRSRLFGLQLDSVREADLARWIAECEKASLVRFYTTDRKPYLVFHKLGTPRAGKSRWPDPPNEVAEQIADENICAQMNADECNCDQTLTVAPYSYSSAQSNSDTRRTTRKSASVILPDIPESLNSPAFLEAWNAWQQHRREKGSPVTPVSASRLFTKFAKWGTARAIAAIDHSIAGGYQGVFEEGGKPNASGRNGSPMGRDSPSRIDAPEGKYDRIKTIVCGDPAAEGAKTGPSLDGSP